MLTQTCPTLSASELSHWLATRIAQYVNLPLDAIEPDEPLSEYGLDSVYALTLIGEVGAHLGVDVDPTVIWDFPTLRTLSQALASNAGSC
ncbi:acyl carrier protein [Pseudomonas gingeri]|uniref:acyl carrier protein n=1 Tax=Pseudomonas gingeri TaxID=117681 RepID=UPI0015A2DEF8|nr:acyl carrier protein [Pseudomonas gingeri]NWA29720.1 acyl carrier protein [Pseudomonas gingeri]NWD71153.1 acyl carrier protein [Pseudomonas gingeri]